MTSLRGFVYGLYTRDDLVTQYAKQVQQNYAIDPIRGWSIAPAGLVALWPTRAKPRMVFGVSPTTGRRNYTIVAHPQADLWTGAATVFQSETDDGSSDDYVVTRRRGESFAVSH